MKKATRKRKSYDQKNQPLKVVYISNPMRVHTSASQFRALVQELTGQDAEFPLDPLPKFSRPTSVDDTHHHHHHHHHQEITNLEKKVDDVDVELLFDVAAEIEDSSSDDDFLRSSYESLEDILTRDMMENLAAISRPVDSSSFVIDGC